MSQYRCNRCKQPIVDFTPHTATRFAFVNENEYSAWQHFCAVCSKDPECAIMLVHLMEYKIKGVQIRGWWL